jgi:ATP-binding cassette, subfamily C (CFTR/MRP), member 1
LKTLPFVLSGLKSKGGPVEEGETTKPEKTLPKAAAPLSEDKISDLTRQTGDIAVYKYWFAYITKKTLIMYLCFQVARTFCSIFPQVILNWWTADGGLTSAKYIVPYVILGLAEIAFNGLVIW